MRGYVAWGCMLVVVAAIGFVVMFYLVVSCFG